MTPVINLMVARVVQFSETHYDKEGIFLEFLVDTLRPVIVENGVAIDIFSHQIFEKVPMIDGIIAIDALARLDRESLYAYTIHQATFPDQSLPELMENAMSTYKWYHEEYLCDTEFGNNSSSKKNKVIPFPTPKQKKIGKKEN